MLRVGLPLCGRARREAPAPGALVVLAVSLLVASTVSAAAPKAPEGFEMVVAKAQQLARASFKDPGDQVPQFLLDLSYDQWRDIRFRPDRALWRGKSSSFEVQFFHPGLFYAHTVKIHTVDAGGVHDVAFSPSNFDYGKNDFASRVPQDLGYAGFRIHYPIKTRGYKDEVVVFLGASYFRALGRDLFYGISARGLAVDTALPSGEEFPFFSEFWLLRPAGDAKEIELYALMDSQRVTGAYRFVIFPGEQTIVDVEARVFQRKRVGKLGIAPLTSMFFFGENGPRSFDDFRPEVHDSDGLLLSDSTGEWIWRPLRNPRTLTVNEFRMKNPRGFGLIQRDRDFQHYQDLETRAELRPSVWVVPKDDWGAGLVELVQIPTQADIHDNIVAYWVPDRADDATEPLSFAYRTYWYAEDPSRPPDGRVLATREDSGTHEDGRRFVVDFAGKKLKALRPDTILQGVVTVGSGNGEDAELLDQVVVQNPVDGSWRLTFQVRPKNRGPVELRAFLKKGNEALTETWSYVLEP